VTRRRFADQWSESNPRFRAAHAVASYLEREGIAPLSAGGTAYSDDRRSSTGSATTGALIQAVSARAMRAGLIEALRCREVLSRAG
jgi:hypothetical protein